ncbi:Tda11p Ecym_2060 [Eremothecium cymbalariae DBVPG|uniref:Topoisomerase I damage affected protein 11 n=1 Tax=Eremothecium cymbalariae (strain CBS 270.75 / DBVPG 7215 / KCTC 17166 / NRRL Y-17582) TaxID=931890 RepID=G8JP17_ERECY|nr:Hypothetical protein Ecym_2060 [Eremothecium cymbalariae DBVPG\
MGRDRMKRYSWSDDRSTTGPQRQKNSAGDDDSKNWDDGAKRERKQREPQGGVSVEVVEACEGVLEVVEGDEGTEGMGVLEQGQMSPRRSGDKEYPLMKDGDMAGMVPGSGRMRRSNTSIKRRSLIQSIISPPADVSGTVGGGSGGGGGNGTVGSGGASGSTTGNNGCGGGRNSYHHQRGMSTYSPHPHSRTSSIASITSEDEMLNDVSMLLQTLATKELELLERRKTIEDLKRHLTLEENALVTQSRELQELKLRVSRVLDPTPQYNGVSPIQFDSRLSAEREGLMSGRPQMHSNSNIKRASSLKSVSSSTKPESVWAKSLSFLNDFDQILQDGLEKRLGFDELTTTPTSVETAASLSEERKQGIWGLVQDFKAGLLGLGAERSSLSSSDNGGASQVQKQRKENVDIELIGATKWRRPPPAHTRHVDSLKFVREEREDTDTELVNELMMDRGVVVSKPYFIDRTEHHGYAVRKRGS